jgi:hypothetical protein
MVPLLAHTLHQRYMPKQRQQPARSGHFLSNDNLVP